MYLGCVHSSAFGGSDQQVSPRPRLALDGLPDSVPDRRTAWLGSEEPQGRAQSPCPAWKGSAKQLWAVQVGILGYWDIGATTPQDSRDPLVSPLQPRASVQGLHFPTRASGTRGDAQKRQSSGSTRCRGRSPASSRAATQSSCPCTAAFISAVSPRPSRLSRSSAGK